MKIKLTELKQDNEILEIRRVNPVFVSRYRQAMRAGAQFPPLIVDKDGTIISGNHRYQAAIEEFGESHKIECERRTYKNEAERIADAIRDNSKHGNPLDGISRKRAICRLISLGMPDGDVANLIGVSIKKLEEIAGETVIVRGNGNVPVKRGLEHIAGETVAKADYDTHIKKDMGIPAKRTIEQLIRWIENGWIDMNDEGTADAIARLKAALS